MGCFVAPVVEAVAVSLLRKKISKETQNPFLKRLNWLSSMLWGGSALLAFEHLWHGELTPWFPFLTGMATEESTSQMLLEIGTVGVAMCMVTTLVWVGMVLLSQSFENRAKLQEKGEN